MSAPARCAELMNRTRVGLCGEERMKFSTHRSRPLVRDRTASRLRKSHLLILDHVSMCASLMMKKQDGRWGMRVLLRREAEPPAV